MSAADLAAADGLAAARAWLLSHPGVTAALGGPDRVGPRNEPPFPRVRLTDSPGTDRDLRWLLATDMTVHVLGDYDGTPGKAELRRILYTVLGALTELPSADQSGAGVPIVTSVISTAGGGWSPEPSGQPRYVASVRVYIHPPFPS